MCNVHLGVVGHSAGTNICRLQPQHRLHEIQDLRLGAGSEPERDKRFHSGAECATGGRFPTRAAKGLRKVEESQHPDLIVVTSSGLKQQTSYNAWGTGGWRWGGGMATVTPETTTVGTLVVDIYDANGKQMIWRGISKDTLSNKGEKNEKEMNKDIAKMFKQYP